MINNLYDLLWILKVLYCSCIVPSCAGPSCAVLSYDVPSIDVPSCDAPSCDVPSCETCTSIQIRPRFEIRRTESTGELMTGHSQCC